MFGENIAWLQGYRRCSTKLRRWWLTRRRKDLCFGDVGVNCIRCGACSRVACFGLTPGFNSWQDAIDVLNDQYKPNAQTRDASERKGNDELGG